MKIQIVRINISALFLLFISGSFTFDARAESLYSKISNGNELYKQEKYDEALNKYVDAQVENPEDPKLKFNIASSQYKMKNYEESLKGFLDVAATAKDALLEEKALYNAGNAMYRQGKLEEAVEYYKKALALDPNDKDAQQNLEFAREEIKRKINEAKNTQEKQKEQQKNEQQEEKKDKTCPNPKQQQGQDNQTQQGQQQQQEQQEEQKQDQPKDEEGKGQEQNQQQGGDEKQEQAAVGNEKDDQGGQQQDGKPVDARQMSKEQAEQLLNSVQENRENLKEGKQKQARGKGSSRPAKDW